MRAVSNASGCTPGAFCFLRIALLALAVLLPVGCDRLPPPELVIHNGPEAETLDPQVLTGQPDGRIAASLFEGFTRFDPKTGKAVPGLASSWDISPDRLTYTFHLRPEARWSTGEPITADQFVWTWNRAVKPETGCDYSGFFYYVKGGRENVNATRSNTPPELGIHALDARTARVDLVNPTPFFLELCAMRVMCVAPPWAILKYGDQWLRAKPLPCSGAFQLLDWRPNDRVRLARNPFYWDAANVALDRVDILSGDAPNTALNLYLTGEVDYLTDRFLVPDSLVDVVAQRPDFHRFNYLGNYFIRFNTTRPPFTNALVRRAFSLAFDRVRIVERITRLGERPAVALTPPGTGGYTPPPGLGQEAVDAWAGDGDVEVRRAAMNAALDKSTAEARRLLAEAGFPGGAGFPVFSYMYNAGIRLHEEIAVEWQAMLRDRLGVRMELRPVEWKTYLSDMSKLNFDVIRGSWVGDYDDPTTFLDCFLSDSGNNRTGWKNMEYDRLLADAARTVDREERFAILRRAETILVRDEVPILPVYYYTGMMGFDDGQLSGIYATPTDEHPLWAIRVTGPRRHHRRTP
jgi:oligopeptide transport system substrate-binding protein